jgi:GntR family transcriptional repressor for pyruvate dehydrogenase complex
MPTQDDQAVAPEGEGRADLFRPVRVPKAADEVIAVIADAIRGGLYVKGDRLPSVRELSQRLEVSGAVVSEAIKVLASADIVSVRRGSGGGIVVRSIDNVPLVIAGLHGETRSSLRVILEARRSAEMTAVTMAAANANAAGLSELSALVEELDSLVDDPDRFLWCDVRFHLALVRLGGNQLIADFHARVISQLMSIRAQFPWGRIQIHLATELQHGTFDALSSGSRSEILDAHDRHLAALEETFLAERLPFP